jgi:hypothetical protein
MPDAQMLCHETRHTSVKDDVSLQLVKTLEVVANKDKGQTYTLLDANRDRFCPHVFPCQ